MSAGEGVYDIKSGTSQDIFSNRNFHNESAVKLWPFCWRKGPSQRILACVQMDSFDLSESLTLEQYVICSLSPDGKEARYLTDLKEQPAGEQ